MRIMGKRQIGELQPFELVIAIMLSELAAVPMQDTGIPLINGIIPILTLMCIEIIISFLTLKSQKLRRVVCGIPSILIEHGKLNEIEMQKQRFNLDDLMEDLRMLGYLDISDIEYAIVENSGKMSIIPKSDASPPTRKDMKIKENDSMLPIGIILDGKLNKENLRLSGYDEAWLNKQLKKNHVDKYEDVFIAILDSKGSLFVQKRCEDNEK
jgi:uncharacterized membrane protein YcaP (DUF421 family)